MTARRGVTVWLSVWAAAGWGDSALGQIPNGYEVVTLAETSASVTMPDINNVGQVTWAIVQNHGNDDVESNVFVYSPGQGVSRITNNASLAFDSVINDPGDLAWFTAYEAALPFYATYLPAGSAQPVVIQSPGRGAGIDIGNSGWVVWTRYEGTSSPSNIQLMLFDGESVQQITENEMSNQLPRINSAGDVVWTLEDHSQFPRRSAIMLYHNGIIQQLTDWTPAYGPAAPDINDLGQVVWSCGYGCETLGIYFWEDGQTSVIREDYASQNPRVNNMGQIVFGRWHEEFQAWHIWLFDGDTYRQITGLGSDPEDWNTDPNINDHGEVSWRQRDAVTFERSVRVLRQTVAVPCEDDSDCSDGSPCTHDTCTDEMCANPSVQYGDINADGEIDILDIFCVLDGFLNQFTTCSPSNVNIYPCEPDGRIDIFDILAVLDAFTGSAQECCP